MTYRYALLALLVPAAACSSVWNPRKCELYAAKIKDTDMVARLSDRTSGGCIGTSYDTLTINGSQRRGSFVMNGSGFGVNGSSCSTSSDASEYAIKAQRMRWRFTENGCGDYDSTFETFEDELRARGAR